MSNGIASAMIPILNVLFRHLVVFSGLLVSILQSGRKTLDRRK